MIYTSKSFYDQLLTTLFLSQTTFPALAALAVLLLPAPLAASPRGEPPGPGEPAAVPGPAVRPGVPAAVLEHGPRPPPPALLL